MRGCFCTAPHKVLRVTGFEPAASCSQTCLRKFIRRFPALFDAFRCSCHCSLVLSGTLASTCCFQLMGWVRDVILYIKRCVLQVWAGDTENTGPAAECAAGPVRGFVQILRWCKQGKGCCIKECLQQWYMIQAFLKNCRLIA